MKIHSTALLIMSFIVILGGCDSNNDDGDFNGNGDIVIVLGTMEALVDGTQWDATTATANRVSVGGPASLIIAGAKVVLNNTAADAMTISMAYQSGTFATGSFSLGDGTLFGLSFTYGSSLADNYLATSGNVTISLINDEKVTGTFSFEGSLPGGGGTVSITSGSFDVEFSTSIGT